MRSFCDDRVADGADRKEGAGVDGLRPTASAASTLIVGAAPQNGLGRPAPDRCFPPDVTGR
ncbi:hypothetical protein GCM10023235_07270 [Kitasatospora terrestris]|uniref:Uncharacterized protein n=1 Tax=Kitasatospora terrestris TaxID=258051 RepID=A0ABP9DC87_9ACTN